MLLFVAEYMFCCTLGSGADYLPVLSSRIAHQDTGDGVLGEERLHCRDLE